MTDSFQPQIYKVDRATRQVSILVRSERLMPAEVPAAAQGTQPYLNGIVYHPDGYLIAADYTRGLLWKVTLDSAPTISEIRLPQRLKGPDGLRLKNAHELVIVQSFPGAKGSMSGDVTLLSSNDGWASAHITAVATPSELDGPTGAALRDGEVWVVNSRYPPFVCRRRSGGENQDVQHRQGGVRTEARRSATVANPAGIGLNAALTV